MRNSALITYKVLWLFFLVLLTTPPVISGTYEPQHSPFSVRIENQEIPYKVFSWYVMPNQKLHITSDHKIEISAVAGDTQKQKDGWLWIAPNETGYYPVQIKFSTESMELNIFVVRPAKNIKDGKLGNYNIGQYNKKPLRGLSIYRPPRGFIEVQEGYQNIEISPHFTLGQFLSKQNSNWPKYLVLRPELLLKLEFILEKLNEYGISTDSLVIMSGFRTPWYNKSIGNNTRSSRHLYGGAADIFVDVAPMDGIMDDLNKDGKTDKADAKYLYEMIEKMSKSPDWTKFTGGLAAYGSTKAHGPFVHIDVRGYKARWGR